MMQDRPGFIVNRILMPMINEAFFAFMEVRGGCGDCCAWLGPGWDPWMVGGVHPGSRHGRKGGGSTKA